MMRKTLQEAADDLEARIKEGNRLARQMAFGRLVTGGAMPLHLAGVVALRSDANLSVGDRGLFDPGLLEQHGYLVRTLEDGKHWLVGPAGCPEGAPPNPGSVIPDDAADAAAVGHGGGSSGGGALSPDEARRELQVHHEYLDWARQVRRQDIWEHCQERRALVIGRAMYPDLLESREARDHVRRRMRESGADPVDQQLWTEADLRADGEIDGA